MKTTVEENQPERCPNCGSDDVYYERFGNEIVCHDCSWAIVADTGVLKYEGDKQ